jgi:hypothetical protein
MPLLTPSYGGFPIFGLVTSFQHIPKPTAIQLSEFCGINGMLSLQLGGRGRIFAIGGVLNDISLGALNFDEGLLLSYADGIARYLTDTRGRIWPNVIFAGEFTPDPMGPRPTDKGWCLPYHCAFIGLT